MLRLGLCCIFVKAPIKFRRTTARYLLKRKRSEQLSYICEIILANISALQQALTYCQQNGIGDFRINSQFWPLKTHPKVGYKLQDLPSYKRILAELKFCRNYKKKHNIRLTFHPDQFVVLSSPRADVVKNSISELEYQAELADLVDADVINVHGGGAYGNKKQALKRLSRVILQLPVNIKNKLTLENDDKTYTPSELLPVCFKTQVPLVYDVHHHRCLPDDLDEKKATDLAIETWQREPCFHISSPKFGWNSTNPKLHHDYIDSQDFPKYWLEKNLTVEVEAKAKELAVQKLKNELYSLKNN